jgi:hypothetical protein
LLGFDDGDGLAVDQDGVWRAFDLGLLVAQLGGEAVGVVGADDAGQGKKEEFLWTLIWLSLTPRTEVQRLRRQRVPLQDQSVARRG